MNTISTKEVQRRTLNFDTIEQCVEELDRIKAAGADGPPVRSFNDYPIGVGVSTSHSMSPSACRLTIANREILFAKVNKRQLLR